MENFLNGIIRRFNLVCAMYKEGILEATDPLCIEFSKLNGEEINYFTTFVDSYTKKQSSINHNFIRQRLIDLGYSNKFVDYLTNNSNNKTQIMLTKTEETTNLDTEINDDIDLNKLDNSEIDFNISDSDSSELEKSDNINEDVLDDDDDNSNDDDSYDNSNDDNKMIEYDTNFVWRPNQCKAINNTIKQGFKSGIHNQYMGTGKTYIILNLISEHYEIYKTPMVYLLLCDRQEILRKMWFDDDGQLSESNKRFWKRNQIIDLGKFNFIEYVNTKNNDIIKKINIKRNKPVIMICNNAFMRSNDYMAIKSNRISMVLVDECHSVSAPVFYNVLYHMKYQLKVPIIGFSATPLRPKSAVPLCKIYSETMDETIMCPKLNIISQYGLFDSIQDGVILPLNHHFIEVKYSKGKEIPQFNYDVTKNVILNILPSLPYKKLICWCRTIKMLKKWYEFFVREFSNLKVFMSSHKDKELTEQGFNCNFDKFYNIKKNSVMVCVNRYREGSDIPNLDCGIYLDAVKNRSVLVAMQTSGRVVRPDEFKLKKCGMMIDMFISQPNKSANHMTIDKILSYYDQIINLAENVTELRQSQEEKFKTYFKYKKLLTRTHYDEDASEIYIKIDSKNKIRFKVQLIDKSLDWTFIRETLELNIKTKFQIKNYAEFKLNLKYITKLVDVKTLNPLDWTKWYNKLSLKNSELIPGKQIKHKKYQKYWDQNNWFTALGIDNLFYKSVEDLAKQIGKRLEDFDDYLEIAETDKKMPLDVTEYYNIKPNMFTKSINKFIDNIVNKNKPKKFHTI